MNESELKQRILMSLENQGFNYNPHVRPPQQDKTTFKTLQQKSRIEQIQLHKKFLSTTLKTVKQYIPHGKDIEPNEITLELRTVKAESLEGKLFNWWNFIWWSVPYQRGYGRLMRFLLWDTTHNAPFGLISLQSPILSMSIRDDFLEIPRNEKDIWINQSMQAQRLGALPPYHELIGGKMAALAVVSNEIRESYKNKYTDVKTRLKNRILAPQLLFITTTSAFGRSSIYNRLTYQDELVAQSLGYTKGSGSFHIPEELYLELIHFLSERGENVARSFGHGPSRKIKLLNKGLKLLGLPNCTYHNIHREFFLFPLVKNLKAVIKHQQQPEFYDRSLNDLFAFWQARWCLPKAKRNQAWKDFNSNQFLENIVKTYSL
ncbi:MAG: DUF4338 domain-containing protein [Pseudomonadota bacterium]|nr:DUF4338 domain-containing protein [Pseudomonadota bacterium]